MGYSISYYSGKRDITMLDINTINKVKVPSVCLFSRLVHYKALVLFCDIFFVILVIFLQYSRGRNNSQLAFPLIFFANYKKKRSFDLYLFSIKSVNDVAL